MTDGPTDPQQEETHSISLHVPGILRLLSEHLYSDPRVALREILQNAYDSCQRRQLEDTLSADYHPHIDVSIDPTRRQLIVADNGSGLTRREIQDYLATIGRGYTAELRDRLQFGGREEALHLIGQFGLGILSAFIVADRVTMVTRSYQTGSGAWRWQSSGEESYQLAPATRHEVGSTLVLDLKLAGEFLLNADVLVRAIRTYADFLNVPISLNGSERPVNALDAPWHTGADEAEYRRYLSERFSARFPLAVVPLHDHVEIIKHADGTTDTIVTPLGGVLFVPTGSVISVREYGDVTVYVRRMFITDDERDLLPRWARFVRGVVDSPILHPTVSREQLRRDEAFFHIQHALEQQLLSFLQELAHSQPAAWRNIVIAHNDLIKGWALESRPFFDAVCELVTFETSRGRLTLPAYREISGGDLYYFVEERGATQEKTLYEARGLAVIDASRFAEEAFLHAYARTHPGVSAHQLEPGAGFVFEAVEASEPAWEMLIRYFSEQGIPTRAARFEPATIPAILVYPPGSDQIAEARAALEGGEISGPIAGLVEEYLRARDPQQLAGQGTLHLNVANTLMQRLSCLTPEHPAFTAALEIVYYNARFFAGRALTPKEARLGFDMISYSVEQLVRAAEQASAEGRDNPLTGS